MIPLLEDVNPERFEPRPAVLYSTPTVWLPVLPGRAVGAYVKPDPSPLTARIVIAAPVMVAGFSAIKVRLGSTRVAVYRALKPESELSALTNRKRYQH